MTEWYSNTWIDVVKRLNSNSYTGLNSSSVDSLKDKYGKNEIVVPKSESCFIVFIKNLKQLWSVLTIVALVIFFYSGYFYDGVLLSLVLFFNLIFISLKQCTEKKDLAEIQKLTSNVANVLRDSKNIKLPSEELVVGDIVVLNKGDIIPADLRVIESNELKVKEGAITGEGYTIEKYSTKIEDSELNLYEMKNILFKSSVVVDGSGVGVVVATGKNTQIADIINILFENKEEKYLLKNKIQAVANDISLIAFIIAVLNAVYRLKLEANLEKALKEGAMILTAFIPQNIIILIILITLIILRNMQNKGVSLKNLAVIENMAKVNLICIDKIGALTEKNMNVSKIYINEKIIDPKEVNLRNATVDMSSTFERILNIGVLCNDTKSISGVMENPKGDLMEIGIIKFASKNNINKELLESSNERTDQIPFDTERRIMTTINKVEGKYRANVKGAVDVLINKCTQIMKNGIECEITEEDIKKIKIADINMTNECLSVMAVAYRNFNYEPSLKENIESNLVFVGLIGFFNPLNTQAVESINKSKSMYIKPVILTDDNKMTAASFGKKLNLLSSQNKVLSGVEIDNMNLEEFERTVEKVGVFSRISSKHKAEIVKLYRDHGYTTIINGDRIIDLPSIKFSSIGVTSGKSNVVKRLSDAVFENIEFGTLLKTIEDSRKIIGTIEKNIKFILACLSCQVTFMIINMVKDNSDILSPFTVLWTNIVTMVICAIALIFQYDEEDSYYRELDEDILRNNKTYAYAGAFMGVIIYVTYYLLKINNTVIADISPFIIMNLSFSMYSFYFSKFYLFKNKISNLIILGNVLVQNLPLLILNKNISIFLTYQYWGLYFSVIILWMIILRFKGNAETELIQ